jgi:alpha-galactosidase
MLRILDMQKNLRIHAGPGHWNDPDMLEVGNGMTAGEDRGHFSMWCMLAAPLIAGNDVRTMSKETAGILMNREAILVDQDSLGVQGFKYSAGDSVEFWFKPLAGDDWAVCVLNRSRMQRRVSFDWRKEQVADSLSRRETRFNTTLYRLHDLWTKKDAGTTKKPLISTVPGHDVLFLRLRKMPTRH